jgi:uncharacterized protein (DUF1778 family)
MRPKKRKGERKEKVVQVRLTEEQWRTLESAATLAGADLSTWIRMVSLEKARGTKAET